jgi:hypothetical protein
MYIQPDHLGDAGHINQDIDGWLSTLLDVNEKICAPADDSRPAMCRRKYLQSFFNRIGQMINIPIFHRFID